MRDQLLNLFTNNFAGSHADLEELSNGRVTGSLAWAGFAGQSHSQRQRALAELIRGAFALEDQLRVGAILTFTPEELAVMNSD